MMMKTTINPLYEKITLDDKITLAKAQFYYNHFISNTLKYYHDKADWLPHLEKIFNNQIVILDQTLEEYDLEYSNLEKEYLVFDSFDDDGFDDDGFDKVQENIVLNKENTVLNKILSKIQLEEPILLSEATYLYQIYINTYDIDSVTFNVFLKTELEAEFKKPIKIIHQSFDVRDKELKELKELNKMPQDNIIQNGTYFTQMITRTDAIRALKKSNYIVPKEAHFYEYSNEVLEKLYNTYCKQNLEDNTNFVVINDLDNSVNFDEPQWGYHTRVITKGELGKVSKIREELEELEDAVLQNDKILQLCELSDLIGAIEAYSLTLGMSLEDLKKFSDKTKKAFELGKR
jgi:hypothetical protein